MDNQQQKEIIKAQLKILLELSNLAEESNWIDAWIDLKTELVRKLKKLEA
jgi:hypothetical protein